MQEFELATFQSTDITEWNFEQIRSYLAQVLESGKGTVYTDEASAKSDKSELNRAKKLLEDKRKEYKAQCLAPYEVVEKQIKSLTSMLDERAAEITASVNAFAEQRKREKEQELHAYYLKKAAALGELAEPIWKRILSPKWLNASASQKKTEEEIQLAISKASGELEQIRALKSPYIDTLVENYTGGAAIEDCFKKNEELTAAYEKAGFEDSGTAKSVVRSEIAQNASSDAGITLTIKGDKRQLEQVFDFMRAIGVEFEIK